MLLLTLRATYMSSSVSLPAQSQSGSTQLVTRRGMGTERNAAFVDDRNRGILPCHGRRGDHGWLLNLSKAEWIQGSFISKKT